MKKTSPLSLKKGIISLFFLFLFTLMLSVSAYSIAEWREYGFDVSNRGFQDEVYSGGFGFSGTHIYDSITEGTEHQPLIADFDDDGANEIFISTGNLIKFYKVVGGSIILKDEFNIGSTMTVQAWSGNIDSDDYIEIVAIFGSSIYTINYNGSFNLSLNSSIATTPTTGISCINDSVYNCYFGDNAGNITEYNASTGLLSVHNVTVSGNVFNTSFNKQISPAINDVDNDGVYEIIFPTTDSGNDDSISIFDKDTLRYDTAFSTDGIIDLAGDITSVAGVLVYNIDGVGFDEIIITYTADSVATVTTEHGYIGCYSGGDGSVKWDNAFLEDGLEAGLVSTTNPVMADVDGDGTYEACAAGMTDNGNYVRAKCYDSNGQVEADSGLFPNNNYYFTIPNTQVKRYSLAAGNLGTDANNDLVIGNTILASVGGNFSLGLINLTTPTATNIQCIPSLADVNGDGTLDIIGEFNNYFYVSYSDYENEPPSIIGSFGRSFDNPVCYVENGTIVRFLAAEDPDGAYPPLIGTNYINDIEGDRERLSADCDDDSVIDVVGDYSDDAPYVECNYTTSGNHYTTIYINEEGDESNLYTHYLFGTVQVYIIDGVEGSTCNVDTVDTGADISGTEETTPPATLTDESVSIWLDYITGTDNNSKLFIGFLLWLIIVISLMVGMAALTQSGIAIVGIGALGGIVGFIILTALGIFPIWLLILVFLGLFLLAVLKLGFGMQGGG